MKINIINFIPLVSSFIVIGLGIGVVSKNWKTRLSKIFFLFTLAIFIWLFGTFKLFTSATDEIAIFWDRFIYLGVVFVPPLMHHFSLVFTRNPKQKKLLLVGYFLAVFFMFISQTDYFVKDVFHYEWGVHTKAQFFHHIFLVYFFIFLSTLFVNLYKFYHTTDSSLLKQQARYYFIAFFLLCSIGPVAYLPAYNIGIYPFAYVAGLLFALVLAYAIVRYRLLNIKFVFSRSLIYFVLVTIISFSFVLTSSFAALFFQNLGLNQYLVSAAFAFIVVLGLDPLKNFFASITDRIFFKDKIDYNAVLKYLSNLINQEIDLQSLVLNFEKAFSRHLKVEHTILLLALHNKAVYLPLADYLRHHDDDTADLTALDAAYLDSPLIKYLRKNKEAIITDELERYIYDLNDSAKQHRLNKVLHNLTSVQAGAAMPVFHEGKMTAMIVIGHKVSGEVFSNEDISTFEVLASQLAAALQRSKLYQQVQAFNLKLQKEVDKATKQLTSANEQLKISNEHLKELDAAKSEFMSIASHQLRTPLSGIIGYMSMILEGDYGKMSPEQEQILGEVYQASQRLVRLVNTLLNITRIEAGRFTLNFTPVDLVDTVRTEVKELLPTAQKKNITLSFIEPTTATLQVEVDNDKIRDVFLNLIDNAIKYTPTGSVIVSLRAEDTKVHFMVQDTGVGINPDEAEHLFQKFVRGTGIAKVQPDGSGLGLYIVKKIIEGHDGKIWAESIGQGKGTTFHVLIPLQQKQSNYRAKPERIFS